MAYVHVVTYLTPMPDMTMKISRSQSHGIVGEFCHAVTSGQWPYAPRAAPIGSRRSSVLLAFPSSSRACRRDYR